MRRRYKILIGAALLLASALVALGLAVSHDSPCSVAPAPVASALTMKADVSRCYGPPTVVKLENIPKPLPADDRVIVKVHAASANPVDWHYMRGTPYFMRLLGVGVGVPTDIRVGVDFAGTIESVGRNVTRFRPGDEVFGSADGAFAEYVSVREAGSLTLKPSNMTFEQAAGVPIAAVTALQALREKGQIRSGQQVLINGASGGVGTFAVQIAKAFGAEVTGVCSTRNLALVSSIGADHVVDYTRDDFTRSGRHYDLIIDNVGNHALSEYRHILTPTGALVMVGFQDDSPWMLATLLRSLQALAWSPFISQRFLFLLADQTQERLATLRDLMQAGKVIPVIDRRYPLAAVPEALMYLEQGHARGKIIVTVD